MVKKTRAKGNKSRHINEARILRVVIAHESKTEGSNITPYKSNELPFEPNNETHTASLKNCTKVAQSKLKSLQENDLKIAAGFIIGAIGYAMSWMPVFIPLATAAIAFGVQQLHARKDTYDAYETSLTELFDACKWTMKDLSNDNFQRDFNEIIKVKEVTDMILMLGPLASDSDLGELLDKDINKDFQEQFIAYARDIAKKDSIKFYGYDIEQTSMKSLYYKVYGKDQGFFEILSEIGSAIKNAFTSLFSREESRDETATSLLDKYRKETKAGISGMLKEDKEGAEKTDLATENYDSDSDDEADKPHGPQLS